MVVLSDGTIDSYEAIYPFLEVRFTQFFENQIGSAGSSPGQGVVPVSHTTSFRPSASRGGCHSSLREADLYGRRLCISPAL